MKNDQWKSYFIFTKKERVAVSILLVLIALFAMLPFFWPIPQKRVVIDSATAIKVAQMQQSPDSDATADNDSADTIRAEPPLRQYPAGPEFKPVSLFFFNPNTLDEDGWKRLGVKEKTINTIKRYIGKGGHFKQPEDIRKIYGLPTKQAEALIPYVQIEQPLPKTNNKPLLPEKETPVAAKKSVQQIQPVNINTATEEEWKALPGIGDVLSKRIVKFRTKLKGFISVQQVGQTYGLADSVFQKILPYLRLENNP